MDIIIDDLKTKVGETLDKEYISYINLILYIYKKKRRILLNNILLDIDTKVSEYEKKINRTTLNGDI